MRLLIAYSTKYGSSAWVAQTLVQHLAKYPEILADVCETKRKPLPSPADYDAVVLGGGIYAGILDRRLVAWAENHHKHLKARPLALFLCCLSTGENANGYFSANLPAELVAHASAKVLCGAVVDPARLRLLDRVVLRKVAKITAPRDRRNPFAVEELATAIARDLRQPG